MTGRLADRHGRRRAFLWGLAIFVLGSALCGAAPSVGALVAARVLDRLADYFGALLDDDTPEPGTAPPS